MVMNYLNAGTDYLTQQYAASVGALDSVQMFSSPYEASFNPYNTSVFGANAMAGSYGPAYGYGYAMNPAYNAQMLNQNLQYTLQNQAAGALMTAPTDAIDKQIGVLGRQIAKNHQDEIKLAYDKACQAARAMFEQAGYENVEEEQVKSYVDKRFYQLTGSNLVDSIETYGGSSFWQSVAKGTGIGLLFVDKTTKEQNIEAITGEKESKGSKVKNGAGFALGTVATVATTGVVVKKGIPALLNLLKKIH